MFVVMPAACRGIMVLSTFEVVRVGVPGEDPADAAAGRIRPARPGEIIRDLRTEPCSRDPHLATALCLFARASRATTTASTVEDGEVASRA